MKTIFITLLLTVTAMTTSFEQGNGQLCDQNGECVFTLKNKPVNQDVSYQVGVHQVMPGESLKQISHMYYGSEDLTNILEDNTFLQYRINYDKQGKIANYRIYPGDLLNVRIYGPVYTPPTTDDIPVYQNPVPVEIKYMPWFITGAIFLVLFVFLVIGMFGYLIAGRRREVAYIGVPQPLAQPVTQTVNHQHTHSFDPLTGTITVNKERPVSSSETDAEKK